MHHFELYWELIEVRYVGYLLAADGLKPDPSRIEAFRNMPIPWNKEDVQRFLGFVACLAKLIPQMSEINAPLRALLGADSIFDWQPAQDQAFHKILDLCCQQPVLRYNDVKAPVEIRADASQSGLGGVLMQEGKPVAYTSQSFMPLTGAQTQDPKVPSQPPRPLSQHQAYPCY
uniref:Reverse transcriptase/retrotransposon-derived protein RNase H-like domain-containing protein n=1 Tax=Eptatretus burgeri TaxID=7764 RepID=A0A8C4R625_EPTBU